MRNNNKNNNKILNDKLKVILCSVGIISIGMIVTNANDYFISKDISILEYVIDDDTTNVDYENEGDIALVDFILGEQVEVSSTQEFISVIEADTSANILLTNHIDFSGYVPTSGSCIIVETFTGYIDGQNNAILNLSYPLFSKTDEATFENFLIKGSRVYGAYRSIFVETMVNTTVENVHINDCVLRATSNNGIGPFAGTVNASKLSNISVTDTILGGKRFLGGLFGLSYGETNLENVYVNTDIRHYETYSAGVVTLGYNDSSINVKNSIIDVSLNTSDELYKGGMYGQNGSGDLDGVLVNLTTDTDSINKIAETTLYTNSITASGNGVYTVLESGGTSENFDFEQSVSQENLTQDFYQNTLGLLEEYWDFSSINKGIPTLKSYKEVVEAYNSQINIASSFVDVSSADELINVIEKDSSANINLINDLNFLLFDSYDSAMITNTYSGVFNGNGYAVLNLSIALFDSVNGAEINDLYISGANITGRTGIFAGSVLNSKIQNVHIANSYLYCTNTSSGVGGFAGSITSSLIDSMSFTNCEFIGSKRSGVLAGYGYGAIFLSNIHIDNTVSMTNDSDATGGLIGQNSAYIYMSNSIIEPEFNSNGSSNRAGLVGYSTGELQFVDVYVGVISTSQESIASNIGILHGYSQATSGNMYEWSGTNLKHQYDYAYSTYLPDEDVTSEFFIQTLHLDTEVWSVLEDASSSNNPVLISYQEMTERYESSLPESLDIIKTVSEYDVLIKSKHTVKAELTEEVEYLALLRNLVNNVGYDHLLAYYQSGSDEKAFIEWLVKYENVKMYTEAGEPDGGSYTESIRILYKLYKNHSEDLDNHADTGKGVTYSEMYHKMMFTISHTHATTVGLWVSKTSNANDPNNSTGLGRYEIYKDLMIMDIEYDNYAPETTYVGSILDDIFYTLEMEEMRYVMNGIIDDESIKWFEWYLRDIKNDKRGGYDLLNYTFGYNYVDESYYQDESIWDAKYGFSQYGLTYSSSYPKQWVVFEEGGVCGAISKTAVNAQTVNGRPATVVSQPGHAAYVSFKTDSNGDHYWGNVDTSLATWAFTGKTEKLSTRMPNGWGSDSTASGGYLASYLFISQTALNDYDNYVASEMELLLTDVYADDNDAVEAIYFESIDKLSINLDAWIGLTKLYVADETKTDLDKEELLIQMADALTYQPYPLYHLYNIIAQSITDNAVSLRISNLIETTFTKATKATTAESLEATGVIGVAEYLLGVANTEVATFSFNGDNAGEVVLNSDYAGSENLWYVSINGGQTWSSSTEISYKLTEEELANINEDEDLRIYFSGSDGTNPENHYIIDIGISTAPVFSIHSYTANLFVNDFENRIIGGPDTDMSVIEWFDENTQKWVKIEEERPNLSGEITVEVRVCANGTNLTSGVAEATFTTDTDTDERKYVSIDRLSIEDYSSLFSTAYAIYAIDGTTNTMFHSGEQTDNFITIKLDTPVYLSGFEYTSRLAGTNGIVKQAEIYTSLDNENWELIAETTWASSYTTKSETFEEPKEALYVKMVSKASVGNFLSATMINLFEDITVIVEDDFIGPQEDTTQESNRKPSSTATDNSTTEEDETDENDDVIVTSFDDLNETHWAYEYIIDLADKGIVKGDGTGNVNPNNTITRAEFVTVLATAHGADVSEYQISNFEDVNSENWFAKYVAWAFEEGIIIGSSRSTFSPNDEIIREDICTILGRYENRLDKGLKICKIQV